MSETLDPMATVVDQQQLAEQLLAQAKEQGVDLIGPNGLLNQLTKSVLETALDVEMTEHLGYDKHGVAPFRGHRLSGLVGRCCGPALEGYRGDLAERAVAAFLWGSGPKLMQISRVCAGPAAVC